MKKSIIIILFLLALQNSFSQISISDYDGVDLTNTNAFLPSDVDYHFQITNDGTSDITFIIEVTDLTLPADADGFTACGGGTCAGPFSTVPGAIGTPTFLAAGDTYGEEGNHDDELADVHYISNGSTGQATITFRIYEEGNESNSAEFTLDTEFSDIHDLSSNSINLYPNPVYNDFFIEIDNEFIDSQIVFTNVLGKVIFTDKLNKSVTKFSSDKMAKGLYFYSVVKDGKVRVTKKLIIK